jgi:hypothetical protein
MKKATLSVLTFALLCSPCLQAEGFFEKLGLRKSSSTNSSTLNMGLSQDEITGGLKQALSSGIDRAVASLGQKDGFLNDAGVRIPMPESLKLVERTLRKLSQDKLADEFVTTMNRAAEQAVPEAASILADSVKQMSIADARVILTGTNNAATEYFRRTSATNLYDRFLPIIKKATEQTGVTSAYKNMAAKATGGFSGFGGLGGKLQGLEASDLDRYVTQKTLDGLFLKIAEQEKQIRENPAARGSELLQKVFGAISK